MGAFAYETVDFEVEGLGNRYKLEHRAIATPQELIRMRDESSRRVAQRWADVLRNGRVQFWARGVTFTPEGLKVDFSDGLCLVTAADQYRTTLRFPTKEPNFFPGFYLLLTLAPATELPTGGSLQE